MPFSFIEHLDSNVIVADKNLTVIYMNHKALAQYGPEVIVTNLMDCHNEQSKAKIREIMETREKNVYTIEKNGIKKMIYQTPWIEGEELMGIVEISLVIPFEMEHFVRG
jgi:hypothetical protein